MPYRMRRIAVAYSVHVRRADACGWADASGSTLAVRGSCINFVPSLPSRYQRHGQPV